jgi:hypothetical protein
MVDEAFRGPKGGPGWNIAASVAIRALGLKAIAAICSKFWCARCICMRARLRILIKTDIVGLVPPADDQPITVRFDFVNPIDAG